jgi:hypothetical protein
MTILLNCCCLNIIPVVEGLQENDCYVPFRPKDRGAANYEVVERKDQSNANVVKQDSQETALYSIVDKKSSGKYTNSKVCFFILGLKKMLLLAKYKNESCYFLKVHAI